MGIEDLPVWGQLSIYGILLALIVLVIVLFLKGEIVARKEVDGVRDNAELFRKAWEVDQMTIQRQAEMLGSFTVTMQTVQKILESMPTKSDLNAQK